MNRMPNKTSLATLERDLAREEASTSRLTWTGGVTVTIVTVAALIALSLGVGEEWQFALYTIAGTA